MGCFKPIDYPPLRTTFAKKRYIEGDITASERVAWEANFDVTPDPLTAQEKDAFLGELSGVSLSSDAFFPFRDSIDHASKVRNPAGYLVSPIKTEGRIQFWFRSRGD